MDWLLQYSDPSIDWSYAMITLVVRFVGVFVVMLVMQVALQASAQAVRWIESRPRPGSNDAPPEPVRSLEISAAAKRQVELDASVVAAIGLALELESRARSRPKAAGDGPSSWAMAGRMRQLSG